MELLEAGKIVAIHALKGEVRVQPWCDGPEFLTHFKTLYLAGEPVKVRSARPSKNIVILKLDGIDTPEAAQKLVNRVLFLNRAQSVKIFHIKQCVKHFLIGKHICMDQSTFTNS